MRIANSWLSAGYKTACAHAALLVAFSGSPLMLAAAQAEDTAGAAPMAIAMNNPPPSAMPSVPPPASPAVPTQMPTDPLANPADNGPKLTPSVPGSEISKHSAAIEQKATDTAKSLVKRLDSSADSMTLDDLNSARQTVARLEAMIDVEKHLAELDKVRGERNGSHPAATISPIPASVLAPMPMHGGGTYHSEPPPPVVEKPKPSYATAEISRVVGSEGRYSAVLKLGDGSLKPVRAGDQLADHVTVRSISASSVVLDENGETRTLHIRNVDPSYTAIR